MRGNIRAEPVTIVTSARLPTVTDPAGAGNAVNPHDVRTLVNQAARLSWSRRQIPVDGFAQRLRAHRGQPNLQRFAEPAALVQLLAELIEGLQPQMVEALAFHDHTVVVPPIRS